MQSRSNVAEGLESNTKVLATKSGAKHQPSVKRPVDIRAKKKIIWPPEKKQTMASVAQPSYIMSGRNTTPENGKSTALPRTTVASKCNDAENNELKMARGQLKKTESERSSRSLRSSVSNDKEPIGTQHMKKPDQLKLKETKSWPITPELKLQGDFGSTVVDSPSPCLGKSMAITEHITQDFNMMTTARNVNNSMTENQKTTPSKTKKIVRFAPDVVQQSPPELSSEEEGIAEFRQQNFIDTSDVYTRKTMFDVRLSMKPKHLASESSKGQEDAEINKRPDEYRYNENANHASEQELANVETLQEIPKIEEVHLKSQTDDVIVHSTSDETEVTTQETPKIFDDTQDMSVSPRDSAKQNEMEHQQEHLKSEERTSEGMTSKTEKGALPQEMSAGLKNVIQKSNSLKGSPAKPNDKKTIKKGSWSKGKSPLSKLFTSGASEIASNTDPKDHKRTESKTGGILGRFFQSSTEKRTEHTKSPKVEENKEAIQAEEKSAGKDQGVARETAKDEGTFLESPSGQEAVKVMKEDIHVTAQNPFDSAEVLAPLKPPRGGITAAKNQSDITSPARCASLEHADSTHLPANPQENPQSSDTVDIFALDDTDGGKITHVVTSVGHAEHTKLFANPQSRETVEESFEHDTLVSHETVDLSAPQVASGEKANVTTSVSSTNLVDDGAQSPPQSHETADPPFTEYASVENTNPSAIPQGSDVVDIVTTEDQVTGGKPNIIPSPHITSAQDTNDTNQFDLPQSTEIGDLFAPASGGTQKATSPSPMANAEHTDHINPLDNPQSTESVELSAAEGKPNVVTAENTNNTNIFDDPRSKQQSQETLNPSLIEHNMSVSHNTSPVVQEMIKDAHGSIAQCISDDPFQEEPQSVLDTFSSSGPDQSFISPADTGTSVPVTQSKVVDVPEYAAGPLFEELPSDVDHVTPHETGEAFGPSSNTTDDMFGFSLGDSGATNGTPAAFTDPFEMYRHNAGENVEVIGSIPVQPFVGPEPTPGAGHEGPGTTDPWSFGSNPQPGQADVDFDIFSALSAAPVGAIFDQGIPEASASVQFSDDIFGICDTSTSGVDMFPPRPPSGTSSGTVSDILGLDSSSIMAQPIQSSLLMDDISTLASQSISATNTATDFLGDFGRSGEQKTENNVSNSWMDDLLG